MSTVTRESKLKAKIVRKLLAKKVTGGHKKQIDTVVGWTASHDQGRAKELLDEMSRDPDCPVEAYGGGARENIRLSSIEEGVDFLEDLGGDLPWGFKR